MRRTFEAFVCLIAGGLLVFLPMFMLYGAAKTDFEEQRAELDLARAAVVELEGERLAVYCRGVADAFAVHKQVALPIPDEWYRQVEQFCLDGIPSGDHAPGFRGP